MGQASSEIKRNIDRQRRELDEDVSELQTKTKEALDWKLQTARHPMTMFGLAVGAGALLAFAARRRRDYSSEFVSAAPESEEEWRPKPAKSWQRRKVAGIVDTMTGALIATGAAKLKDFLGETIPGFHEQYARTEREKGMRAV